MKRYHVLLATEDSAVEAAVKTLTATVDCGLDCARTRREALCLLVEDGAPPSARRDLAVVDLDLCPGGRTLLSEIRDVLPIIAITSKPRRWLSSLLRRHRIGATLAKPVSPEALREAFRRVGSIPCEPKARGGWRRLGSALQRWGEAFSQAAQGTRLRIG